MNRRSSLALLLMLSGCAAGETRRDAALGADAHALDAQTEADAGMGTDDAAITDDAAMAALDAAMLDEDDAAMAAPDAAMLDEGDAAMPVPDAFTPPPDAFTPPPDAFTAPPDAFTPPDAFAPRDAGVDARSCTGVTMCRDGDGCCPSGCDAPRDIDCGCEARTCGAQRCGSIDDGCGSTVNCGAPCSTWARVASPPFLPRDRVILAHLGADRALLLEESSHQAFTYEAVSNTWTMIAPPSTTENFDSAAYAGDGRVVVVTNANTYEYDGATWTSHGAPPVRLRNGLSYAGPGRVVHFGGHPSTGLTTTTYMYRTTTHAWSEVAVSGTLPARRTRANLEWIGGGRLLLTGGLASGAVLDDAWIFDTNTRTWATTADPRGGGRLFDALAHLRTGVVLHYGGKDTLTSVAASNGFKRFEAGVWTAFVAAADGPGQLFDHAMVYLSPGRVLMVEGTSTISAGVESRRGFAWVYDVGTGTSDYGL